MRLHHSAKTKACGRREPLYVTGRNRESVVDALLGVVRWYGFTSAWSPSAPIEWTAATVTLSLSLSLSLSLMAQLSLHQHLLVVRLRLWRLLDGPPKRQPGRHVRILRL